MEPDHSANVARFMEAYPDAVVVASSKAFAMMKQFFGTDFADRRQVVGDGDTLCLGSHTLRFVTAPMVHWPEVIMTYDESAKVLFSADAFGKFGGARRAGGLGLRGAALLHRHCGEIRRAGAGCAGQAGGSAAFGRLPPARAGADRGAWPLSGALQHLVVLWRRERGGCHRLHLGLRAHARGGGAAGRPAAPEGAARRWL